LRQENVLSWKLQYWIQFYIIKKKNSKCDSHLGVLKGKCFMFGRLFTSVICKALEKAYTKTVHKHELSFKPNILSQTSLTFKSDVFHPEVFTEYIGWNVSVKHYNKMLRNNTTYFMFGSPTKHNIVLFPNILFWCMTDTFYPVWTTLTLNWAKFVLQPRNVNNKTDIPFFTSSSSWLKCLPYLLVQVLNYVQLVWGLVITENNLNNTEIYHGVVEAIYTIIGKFYVCVCVLCPSYINNFHR
jgi:hypothetical protein